MYDKGDMFCTSISSLALSSPLLSYSGLAFDIPYTESLTVGFVIFPFEAAELSLNMFISFSTLLPLVFIAVGIGRTS